MVIRLLWVTVLTFEQEIVRSEDFESSPPSYNCVELYVFFHHMFHFMCLLILMEFPGASGKEPACQCRRCKRCSFNPWVRKIPWRRIWQPTPVSLPGKSHGQRSLVGYSPWDRKELDRTECMHTHMHAHTHPDTGSGRTLGAGS